MSSLEIDTTAGRFTIQLYAAQAPHTCHYYRTIAVNGSLHGGSAFRITTTSNESKATNYPIHVVQFGTENGFNEQRSIIEHESTDRTGLQHRRWTVSASRYAPGELYGSFFVCMRDEPALDFGGDRSGDGLGFSAFGQVMTGHQTLEKMYARAEDDEILARPIPITGVGVD